MINVDTLNIEQTLKDSLNARLNEFRTYRYNAIVDKSVSEITTEKVEKQKAKGSVLSLLFKEYDSMNDLVKDFSSHILRRKVTV